MEIFFLETLDITLNGTMKISSVPEVFSSPEPKLIGELKAHW